MNALRTLVDSPVIERLGWTLLHSVWQGLAVAIVLALCLPVLRRRGARASCAVCCGALLLSVLLPAATFCLLPEPQRPVPVPGASAPERSQPIAAEPTPAARPVLSIAIVPPHDFARSDFDRARNEQTRTARSANQASIAQPAKSVPSPSKSPAQASSPPPSVAAASWTDRGAALARRLRDRLSQWLPGIVLVWGLGVLGLSLWNLGGWFAARRLKESGTIPAPVAIQRAAVRIAEQFGLTRGVRLLQSVLVDSPVVIGALKPVILLPASLITEIPADQLESLLAHELAHVLRHDYLVNLIQSAIETLLFYHPAVWWISAQVRAERENCCDDLALAVASDRAVYVRALASVAGARPSRVVPAASGGRLIVRLQRILGVVDPVATHPSRWLTGVAILSLCGAAIAFFTLSSHPVKAQAPAPQEQKKPDSNSRQSKAPQQKVPQPKPEAENNEKAKPQVRAKSPQAPAPASAAASPEAFKEPQFPTKEQMQIRVIDTAGKPIPEAFIQTSIWTKEKSFRANRNYKCDSRGITLIVLPKTLSILRIWTSKGGYVGEFQNFQTNTRVHELKIPDEFVVRLSKGASLRGIVKNEKGEPVPGARIEWEWPADKLVQTDALGRWQVDDVRPGNKYEVKAVHPDYLGNEVSDAWSSQKVTAAVGITEVPAIILRRGIRALVRVTDPSGKPVQGAPVIWGDNPYFRARDTAALTDVKGFCSLPAFPAGPMRISVVLKGWMPDSREVNIGPNMRPVDFQLRPGRKLRIRFVDRAGAPLPGVFVSIERWHGVRNLASNVNGVVKFKIPNKSDKQGIFEWDWAPGDAVTYRFGIEGFANTEQALTADGREHVVTFNRELHISGRVRDAVTGRSIEKFVVVPVIHFRPDFPSLERNQSRQGKAGTFAMAFDRTDIEHGVQIEALGYKTYRTSERYPIGGPDRVLDIRLQPAPHYTGRVFGPDGRPVKGVRVALSSRLEQLDGDIFNERAFNKPKKVEDDDVDDSSNRGTSGRNGAFEIASQLDPYVLVVVAPNGFAEVNRRADQLPGEIRLQRWASLTGRLVQSGKPVPDYEIYLSPIRLNGGDEPHNFSRLFTKTGPDGSFAFEHVPPVACRIEAFLHFSVKSPLTSSPSVPLHPAPGEAVRVELGAGGVDVTGQLVAEHQPPGFDYHFAINYLVARRPGIEPPDFLAGKDFEWQRGWSDSWKSSPEGSAYLNTLHHWFVKPEPDGRFHISGVAPGEYDFAVNLYGTTEGCLVHPIAMGVVHFIIKPGEKQVDLGKVSVPSIALPKVGDVAADFEFAAPDGTKSHLAALRGKYVLIDFWATWCGPCVAKLDEIDRLRKEFRDGQVLVVVGANLDTEPARARDFLKSKPLPWQHALLGDWSSTDIPRRYAISNVPAYVLLDPAGRILASEHSLEAIESKLKDLSKKPAASPTKSEKPQAQKATPSTKMAVAQTNPRETLERPLPRPVTIGGFVKDEQGNPIKGAHVHYLDRKTFGRSESLTDANGHWQLDGVRPGEHSNDYVSISHADYLSTLSWVDTHNQPSLKFDALRSQTAVITLRSGIRVAGKVTDPAGEPIAGAPVIYGTGSKYAPTSLCRADKDGRFHFQNDGPGPLNVTVFAKGWMPEQRSIVVAPVTPSIDFRLKLGKTLRMRIVDGSAAPVPGVYVILGIWRGVNTGPWRLELGLPLQSDKQGLFEWDWAPDDSVKFALVKPGYAESEIHVTAVAREQTRTILPLLHISGSVVDAKTGRPIDDFVTLPVDYHRANSTDYPNVWREKAKRGSAGRFDATFESPDTEHALQIESRGYHSFRTPKQYKIGDANVDLTIRLEPCERYVGRVVDSDKKPVRGAVILVSSWSEPGPYGDLSDLVGAKSSPGQRLKTDANGSFEIPAQLERYLLQVVAPGGYAEAERGSTKPPSEIRLERWAKVTGRLLESGKPVPNRQIVVKPIRVIDPGVPRAFADRQAVTGPDGSFVLERVPPVPSAIKTYLYWSPPALQTSAPSVPARIAPGETVDVTLGGNGIDVTGQCVAENQPADFNYQIALNYLVARRPGIDPPPSLAGKGFDWQRGWKGSWLEGRGKAYLDTLTHWLVVPETNGRFRISGVMPGEYDLAVNLYGKIPEESLTPAATRVFHLSVKPGQTQLDLGKILIPDFKPPRAVDRATSAQNANGSGVRRASEHSLESKLKTVSDTLSSPPAKAGTPQTRLSPPDSGGGRGIQATESRL